MCLIGTARAFCDLLVCPTRRVTFFRCAILQWWILGAILCYVTIHNVVDRISIWLINLLRYVRTTNEHWIYVLSLEHGTILRLH